MYSVNLQIKAELSFFISSFSFNIIKLKGCRNKAGDIKKEKNGR
jgi:hypothetical protein